MSAYAPDWHRDAACSGMDDFIFFGSSDPDERPAYTLTQIEEAREVCRSCPVLEECFSASIENREDYGVWAGTTVSQRKQIIKAMRESPEVPLQKVVDHYSERFRNSTEKRLGSLSTITA